jgi:hypothetical protein
MRAVLPYWPHLALGVLALAFSLASPVLRAALAPVPKAVARALLAIVAIAVGLRAFVVPWTVFSSEYLIYAQLEADLPPASGTISPQNMPGRRAILDLLSAFMRVDVQTLSLLNLVLAALAILAAFAAVWLLTRGHAPSALAAAAVMALDPVHARLTGDWDIGVLMGLCQWIALLGVLVHLRLGRTEGLLLAGAAAVYCVFVKPDSSLGLLAIASLWLVAEKTPAVVPEPRRRRALLFAATALWLLASALALRAIVHADAHYMKLNLGIGPERYAYFLEKLPGTLFVRNPLLNAIYTPGCLPLLWFVGLAFVAARKPREYAWIPLLVVVVLFRVFYDYVDWGADEAQKGNLRWLFHVQVATFTLAGVGAGWLWTRLGERPIRWALPVLGVLSVLPTHDFWTHRWTYQRESDFVLEAVHELPRPCLLTHAANPGGVDASYLLGFLARVEGWGSVPVAALDSLPPEADLSCAYYFEGLRCFTQYPGDAPGTLHEPCQRAHERFAFEPVRTEQAPFEPFCGRPGRGSVASFGFYRLRPLAPPEPSVADR